MPEPTTSAGDFDDLLGTPPTAEEKTALESLQDGGAPAESPELIRIRDLEAKLAAAERAAVDAEDANARKDREHAAALAQTNAFNNAPDKFEDPNKGETLTFHFLDDGITSNGRVWEKGQTVSFIIGGRAHNDTKDRNGVSWIDDLSNEAQIKRWGRLRIGLGNYPGAPVPSELLDPDELARGNRVPVLA